MLVKYKDNVVFVVVVISRYIGDMMRHLGHITFHENAMYEMLGGFNEAHENRQTDGKHNFLQCTAKML